MTIRQSSWLLFILILLAPTACIAQEATDTINYAVLWQHLSEKEKQSFAVGAKSAIVVSLMLIYYVGMESEDQDHDSISECANTISEIYHNKFLSADSAISGRELQLRMDLFYLDDSRKHDKFEKAIFSCIIDALRN